jgi:glycosyltransferase involved in cell wall biosynthesis
VIESLAPQRCNGRSICVSRHLQSTLAARGEERDAVVIPYGVSLPATHTHHCADPFHVVYSGRLWEHQNRTSLVVQSLIRVCQRGQGRVVATLIGDGYSRPRAEEMVREAGLEDRITFAGRLPFVALEPILLRSQAILLMSDFEGLPVALLEAMAAGVVPVARAIASGIPEVVRPGETGLLVGEDPEEAATALLSLAEDPALWQRCSRASRQLVEARFQRDLCHRQWLALLQDLGSGAAPRYPIPNLQGVRLSQLAAPLLAPYRRPAPWQSGRLRAAMATQSARFKASLRSALGRG